MKNLKTLSIAAAFATAGILMACDATTTSSTEDTTADSSYVAEETEVTPAESEADETVVDIAIGSADHTTLVAALSSAELVETLKGNGPFTIFAPTNTAFEQLPAGTVDNLVKPENKEKLTDILSYHVVSGEVKAADLSDGQVIQTINGKNLTVSIKDGTVSINGAKVTAADLDGSNGVVHVIDSVLMPK
ncbi:fasciclin domain-containing protein [Anditalea andensis]|uniref:Fasciclin n=1 Tax=Anditalea andensis TaxID=1048983 RepID=A0A074LJD3_9BACT|nr:fasciclin domain-containing protein [Anditalea andensis]KEO73917.1 fasciclin [Anditalea andensis]